jgi:hypothetical protein
MKVWQLSCFVLMMTAITVAAICQIATMRPSIASPSPMIEARRLGVAPRNVTVLAKSIDRSPSEIIDTAFDAMEEAALMRADVTGAISQGRVLAFAADTDDAVWPQRQGTSLLRTHPLAPPVASTGADTNSKISDLHFLKYYIYSEVPPTKKPAAMVLDALSSIPLGTPAEEVERAADAFGLDPNFMKAVARIESDFDPKQRTGSYIGLFQLSHSEFNAYGTGEITNARDNAVAAAYKFLNEAAMFEWVTHKTPTFSDLYLIHQQGWQGAAEHISHPDWAAWKSMCATDEGKSKGERWCKRAIWANTLPAVKSEWKSVDRLTSGAFVAMWRNRIGDFYARYAQTGVAQAAQPKAANAQ